MSRRNLSLVSCLLVPIPALAQTSDIDPVNKFSWQENCGWMDWRDAGSATQGARDRLTFLAGFVWCENVGWVNLGDGTPGGAGSYTNASATDFGVNVAGDGALSGFAWGENIGWVNFAGGALASPPQPARIDLAAERLRGYAWAENIGWINLDLATAGEFVKRTCYANCDASTTPPILNVQDFACFLNAFAAGDPYANCDRSTTSPALNVQDFACFLNRFASGCP
jgi:hypothetical protein